MATKTGILVEALGAVVGGARGCRCGRTVGAAGRSDLHQQKTPGTVDQPAGGRLLTTGRYAHPLMLKPGGRHESGCERNGVTRTSAQIRLHQQQVRRVGSNSSWRLTGGRPSNGVGSGLALFDQAVFRTGCFARAALPPTRGSGSVAGPRCVSRDQPACRAASSAGKLLFALTAVRSWRSSALNGGLMHAGLRTAMDHSLPRAGSTGMPPTPCLRRYASITPVGSSARSPPPT